MNLLTNPLFVRMAIVLFCSVGAFALGVVALRMLRRGITEDGDITDSSISGEALPLQAYTVIQQLKQQKFVLQSEQKAQQRRAKTSEHITAAIIANLPCGMLFVAPNGLVRQANAAARQILGFASPMGMSIAELFRDARVNSEEGKAKNVADIFAAALQGEFRSDPFDSWYRTPSGEERSLKFVLIPVHAPNGEALGLASVISEETEVARWRQARIMRAEESAEMALEVRNSLSTIREWAQQIDAAADVTMTRSFANDISAEADRLAKRVGGFLAGSEEARAAHA